MLSELKRRCVLVLGIVVLFVLTIYIPTRVFFIDVSGNEMIDESYILAQAEQIGIYFGASRKDIRSEQMKNALLLAVPELKWAGINTYGCRAEIFVLERPQSGVVAAESQNVKGIYAVRDGVVSNVTITKGTALCKPGQAVRKGQLLVSGYTDCGLITRAEQADGEVFGQTQHVIQAVLPNNEYSRGQIVEMKSQWLLQIGKKEIKLHNDSRNYGSRCGKIYKKYTLTLPGGFELPISFVNERVLTYSQEPVFTVPAYSQVCKLADRYVSGTMVAGKIIDAKTDVAADGNVIYFTGVYTCEELIGKIYDEEIK